MEMLEVHVLQVVTNFGHVMRQLHTIDGTLWIPISKAVVDHHFDTHDGCRDWCKRKEESAEERSNSGKFHRFKEKNGKLCHLLHAIISKCNTEERLGDVGHGFDTLVDESLNNAFSWIAPKNKTQSGTSSLRNRLNIALGVNAVGFDECSLNLALN